VDARGPGRLARARQPGGDAFSRMRTIDGYIFRQLAAVGAFVAAALVTAVWLSQSLRFIDYIVNRGLPVTEFLRLVIYLLPGFLGLVLPIALFVAVLFVYSKLRSESELVVLANAGLSPARQGRAVAALALLTTAAVYAISLYGLPASYHAFKNLQFEIRNDYSTVMLQAGRFNRVTDGLTVYVRARGPEGKLRGVLVHDARADAAVTMMARQGAVVHTQRGPRVVLLDGNRQVRDSQTGRLSMLYFDRYTLDLGGLRRALGERWRQPRERYLPNLLNPGPGPDDRRFREELIAEGHRRLTFPLYTLAYAGIGLAAVVGGGFGTATRTQRITGAAVTVAVLQALQMVLTDLAARNLVLVPALYALAVLAVALPLAMILARMRLRRARRPTEAPA